MNLISGIDLTSSALAAQKLRLDVVAQNIANAQTTRTANGGPYQRQVVSFETELKHHTGSSNSLPSVKVSGVTADKTRGQQIYNPQHPDADSNGFVTMPNVNVAFEMVDMISASRAYEANLSVAKSARNLALKTLEIGK
jgi:flagellar basal-body rod protein FlgC